MSICLTAYVDGPSSSWFRSMRRLICDGGASTLGLLHGGVRSLKFPLLILSRSSFRGEKPLKLDEFVLRSDDHLFSPAKGITRLMDHAEVKLINSTSSLTALHDALDKLNLLDEERLRPSWDQYFMQLASLAAHRSNCMKRRVGCVLVRERRVISTGYNGTPRNLQNCNQGGCWHPVVPSLRPLLSRRSRY